MAGLLTGPASDRLQAFFIPGVCLLIFFLGYTSQWLLNTAEYLEPGPMTKRETYIFNILLVCLWSTYYKACTVPPGRYTFAPPPESSAKKADDDDDDDDPTKPSSPSDPPTRPPARWCKKCAAPKPLRAHHCRHCGTCIPRMDHHCPWTANCVSLQTFPYFVRFLVYTNLALWYLLFWLLWPRLRLLFWDNSALPAYLGPRVLVIAHLVLLAMLGALVAIVLGILLATTLRSWALNQTMIEGWEMERHEAVLLRHRKGGGWWTGGGTGPIKRVEFPYDIDVFTNMAQAMGTKNFLSWLDPFVGGGPVVSKVPGKGTGWEWEENGFNDREGMWPPLDPDKMRRAAKAWPDAAEQRREEEKERAQYVDKQWKDPQERIAAFRARQEMDLRRRRGESGIIAELEEDEEPEDLSYDYPDDDSASGWGYDDEEDDDDGDDDDGDNAAGVPPVRGRPYFEQGADGEPGWTNSEGDRLRDYGVDEDADDDDEDIPLGELLRRRKAQNQ